MGNAVHIYKTDNGMLTIKCNTDIYKTNINKNNITSNNCCDLASRSLLAASCFSVLSNSFAKRACSRSNLAAARAACCRLATSILCSTGKLVFKAAFNSSNLKCIRLNLVPKNIIF